MRSARHIIPQSTRQIESLTVMDENSGMDCSSLCLGEVKIPVEKSVVKDGGPFTGIFRGAIEEAN